MKKIIRSSWSGSLSFRLYDDFLITDLNWTEDFSKAEEIHDILDNNTDLL